MEYKGLKDIRLQKYYDNGNDDDIEYAGSRCITTLFKSEEDYYKTVRTSNAFDDNFMKIMEV